MFLPLLLVLVLAWAVSCSTVSEVIPIGDQLPLIARIGQPYNWSFSPSTFASKNGDIYYYASSLPQWLSFEPSTRTFHGTAAAKDEGNPEISVTAQDSASSVTSWLTICVTPYPPPTLHTPVAAQLYAENPALSSVYLVSPTSALATLNPALRIPPQWSFSIGFLQDTYIAQHNLYYYVLQANGSAPPDWMKFNPRSLTLDGVVPDGDDEANYVVPMLLIASDQQGYTAATQPLDIIISPHDLSLCQPQSLLPTINVTQSTPFNISLYSRADFTGICVDGRPIEPAEITSLDMDTSSCAWIEFDSGSRMLSGSPPSDSGHNCSLPVTVQSVNQSLQLDVSVAVMPSYFLSPTITPLTIGDDRTIDFDLSQAFSHATGDQNSDVNLSAAFDSPEGSDCLTFDPETAKVTGVVPEDFSSSHINITFTAYSNDTHSTSHTMLSISVQSTPQTTKKGFSHPTDLSTAAHRKLVLAVGIVFGAMGIVCALGAFLALFRRCARVNDTARTDQEGRNALSDNDKRWYGIVDEEKGYGSSVPRSAIDIQNPFGAGAELVTPVRPTLDYGGIGLGLRRVAERSGSDPISNGSQSPRVMRKGEFMTRIRQTVRNVSASLRRTSTERPVISKPTLIEPDADDRESFDGEGSPNPFDDPDVIMSYPESAIMTNSPSTSTGEHSIPRRRADFAPPKSPALVHFQDGLVASKATSIRSAVSHDQPGSAARPRLVPFTSAARVPIPRVPSLTVEEPAGSPSRRVASQRAMVLKEEPEVKRSPTADELSMGLHYVRSLGGDLHPDPSTPTVSTHARSSFSSLESSRHGHAAAGIMRTLVRSGERFKFRVAVSLYSAASYKKVRKLEAKLMSGKPLPAFLHVDLAGNKHSGVEFYGVPAARDLGEFNVGVYTVDDGACVGRVIVEVVAVSR
ncbi:hypothetical protein C8R47DRAFT_413190 [Mycena vitilis]|nr:hypothetical protein C8R47DRAFT_413190 [Mycena vitilis]